MIVFNVVFEQMIFSTLFSNARMDTQKGGPRIWAAKRQGRFSKEKGGNSFGLAGTLYQCKYQIGEKINGVK